MATFPLRSVAHDERLTVTQHLDELRARLVVSLALLAVLFTGCLWQSRTLLHVLNAPLAQLEASVASITVAFAFALLLGLPFLLLQAWAFAAPAIAPPERRAVRRLLTLAVLLHGTDH